MATFEVPDQYLGDGVYASFDGYHIILDLRGQCEFATGDGHKGNCPECTRINLEPPVLVRMDEYRQQVQMRYEEHVKEREAQDVHESQR